MGEGNTASNEEAYNGDVGRKVAAMMYNEDIYHIYDSEAMIVKILQMKKPVVSLRTLNATHVVNLMGSFLNQGYENHKGTSLKITVGKEENGELA